MIEEDIAFYGMIAGDATLRRGVRFILHGTIAGNLTIERSARDRPRDRRGPHL